MCAAETVYLFYIKASTEETTEETVTHQRTSGLSFSLVESFHSVIAAAVMLFGPLHTDFVLLDTVLSFRILWRNCKYRLLCFGAWRQQLSKKTLKNLIGPCPAFTKLLWEINIYGHFGFSQNIFCNRHFLCNPHNQFLCMNVVIVFFQTTLQDLVKSFTSVSCSGIIRHISN